jgi:GAF domain-containing protein
MAGSIAPAIENATAYQKLQKSKDALEMIYRSSMALATTVDLDHLMKVLIANLRGAMEIEAAGVVLYDEQRGDLYWREVQDDKGLIHPESMDLRLPLDGSISGRVFQTGEPALLNNPTADPKFFKPFVSRTRFAIRNMIIVPLNTREKTIGALLAFNKKGGQFTEADVRLLSSLAGVVAISVENTTFFQEMLNAFRKLEEQNLAKSKILHHLSHELRTPLSIISGTLHHMAKRFEQTGTGEFDQSLQRMNRQIQSLSARVSGGEHNEDRLLLGTTPAYRFSQGNSGSDGGPDRIHARNRACGHDSCHVVGENLSYQT